MKETMNKFNLSEKIYGADVVPVFYDEDRVINVFFIKEFIRLLKEEAKENLNPDESYWFVKFLEEKAGDKLK